MYSRPPHVFDEGDLYGLKRINWICMILAVVTVAAGCGMVTAVLHAGSSYVPEDQTDEMDFRRSRVFVDGTGYRFDENERQEQKKEEVKHEKVIRQDPKHRALVRRSTYKKPAEKPEEETQKKKPKPEKQKKQKKQKDDNHDKEKKEEVSEDPVIITSLKGVSTVNGTTKKFTVKARSFDGDVIPQDKITVKMNGERLLEKGKDTYVGTVLEGKNTVYIKVVDSEGRSSETTIYFTGNTHAEPQVIGSLNVVVTAKALGIDVVVPKKSVKIYDNEQLSDVVKRYFSESSGVTGVDVGSGYYELGHVRKHGIINEIPEDIIEELEAAALTIPDNKDSLGLNDFGPGSGWMYSVNGKSPSQYMSSTDPVLGSDVEIYYTISAM